MNQYPLIRRALNKNHQFIKRNVDNVNDVLSTYRSQANALNTNRNNNKYNNNEKDFLLNNDLNIKNIKLNKERILNEDYTFDKYKQQTPLNSTRSSNKTFITNNADLFKNLRKDEPINSHRKYNNYRYNEIDNNLTYNNACCHQHNHQYKNYFITDEEIYLEGKKQVNDRLLIDELTDSYFRFRHDRFLKYYLLEDPIESIVEKNEKTLETPKRQYSILRPAFVSKTGLIIR